MAHNPEKTETARTALLVIDVQKGQFDKATPVYRAETLLANINLLASRARAAGSPVFVIQHCNDSYLKEGSEGWSLHGDFRSDSGDIGILKRHPDSFKETDLEAHLRGLGAGRVAICGLVTHGCVKATCLGALARGFGAVLAADAHSSFSPKASALVDEWNAALAAGGAEVLPSADIAF